MTKPEYDYELARLEFKSEQGEDVTDALIQLDLEFNDSIDDIYYSGEKTEYNHYFGDYQ